MNVAYEDRKLHNDGIFDSLMGYKEWFHYLGTFYVKEKPLNFMLGFPMSFTGKGAFGWISFEKKQYSLAGNIKDTDKDGFYDLQRFPVYFEPVKAGYTLWYVAEPKPDNLYKGTIEGRFPDYTFDIQTPDVTVKITMNIDSLQSLFTKEVFPWMPKKKIASWFHSGDITPSIEGTVAGVDVTSKSAKNKGWYERMWSKVPVLWPSEWLWSMAHLENGYIFDLYTAKSLGLQVHPLDECWLYHDGTFSLFTHYESQFPEGLQTAIENKNYPAIIGKCITYRGKNGKNRFEAKAKITGFRRYEFRDYSAYIRYTNFIFEMSGNAVIDGDTIDMKGRGAAEWAPMKYWWV